MHIWGVRRRELPKTYCRSSASMFCADTLGRPEELLGASPQINGRSEGLPGTTVPMGDMGVGAGRRRRRRPGCHEMLVHDMAPRTGAASRPGSGSGSGSERIQPASSRAGRPSLAGFGVCCGVCCGLWERSLCARPRLTWVDDDVQGAGHGPSTDRAPRSQARRRHM